ncbi:GNAT family N-acetyltransferase [Shewanella yunxiaonensis]|uniref:GNAT family N-acetyltransferase n=1 Tax=Shewanella yunxiaonensis TaxID=2829809 RepID=A0ABX7YWS9_9GAMM|nr:MULTISPECIES: GNAT family protein [Shewanella]MDF0532915.1 GNAT family protein [Shewanella sp. A32]QUN06796.1 GNAT family N-acetyltransferase [Shewanella yunxiaonensis]
MKISTNITFGPLALKPLCVQQADAFLVHINDNRDVYEDVIPFVSRTHDLRDMQAVISGNLDRQSQGLGHYYTLWDGDTMAGYLLVREINHDANWAEIGYMLGTKWQRRGITTMACHWLIEQLLASGIDKIALCCNDDNLGSMAVAEKLGFKLEGNLRQYFIVNGKRRNMCCYGLLKEEWAHRSAC